MRVVLLALLLAPSAALATDYYVNNSCTLNGNGRATGCATAAGGAGAWTDLHTCDTTMVAGDTCHIAPGHYYRMNETGSNNGTVSGYLPVNNGTAAAPITYTALTASNPPWICSGPSCSTSAPGLCDMTNPAIGVDDEHGAAQYIVFDNLKVVGSLSVFIANHVTVKNCDISVGFENPKAICGETFEGNWTGLRVEWANNVLVQNNFVHDVTNATDRGTGIKFYGVHDSIVEYNTIYHIAGSGISPKAANYQNEFRYNLVLDAWNGTGRVGDEPGLVWGDVASNESYGPDYNNVWHHNVLKTLAAPQDNGVISIQRSCGSYAWCPNIGATAERFYNNTILGGDMGINYTFTDTARFVFYNNIVVPYAGSGHQIAFAAGGPYGSNDCTSCQPLDTAATTLNNNAYSVGRFYVNDPNNGGNLGILTTKAAWTSYWAGRGFSAVDTASQVLDCGFVSNTTPTCTITSWPTVTCTGNWHVQNSACKTMSTTGGYVGAYSSDTACIGYGCSGSASLPGNQAPDGTITSPAADTSISIGGTVTFAGTGTDSDGNTPLTYSWNFGNSGHAASTAQNPGAIQFSTAGTFTVTFTTTDSLGLADPSPATRIITVVDPNAPTPLSKTGWKLQYVDSQETAAENAPGTNAFDSQTTTFWHTQWQTAQPACPHEIQINLGASYAISGFRYLPRQDGETEGFIGQYEFYVSADGINWGTAVATGTYANDATEKETRFTAKTGQYVRLRALSEVHGLAYTSAAEITVLGGAAAANTAPSTVTNEVRTDTH